MAKKTYKKKEAEPKPKGTVNIIQLREKRVFDGVRWKDYEVGQVYEVDSRTAHIWVSKGEALYK